MRLREPGKVCESLWCLGQPESCVYVLEGKKRSMLISGGMSYILPDVLAQMKQFNIDQDSIQAVLILHAHFDHIGIIPYFTKRSPTIQVYASQRAWLILGDPKKIATINMFSSAAAARIGLEKKIEEFGLHWSYGMSGETVVDGQIVDLGDKDVQIIETPGHSSCSISAYVPQLKVLFPSDSGGIPFKDSIIISGNSNYTKYQQSLEKLASLDVEYVCADHFGYISGQEAGNFIYKTIEQAAQKRETLEKIYLRTNDVDVAAKEVAAAFSYENPDYFLPIELYEGICRQVMRHIASCLDSSGIDR